ncbi:mechanosensitive ion channel domain-containing protein [Salinisphaera sp. T31B1]|uniref:mechanosensitive ion channel family protein n=1 Tax=Salinisphaera sp. T31B1 TaxID=727963 RepID=UPI0033404290
MEMLQHAWESVRSFLHSLFTTNVVDGQSLSDYITLKAMLTVAGDVVLAIIILMIGMMIARWVARRLRRTAQARGDLDNTLFKFLGSIARYVILGFTFLFILNTFGIQTTSIIAALGAAGLAVGLALQGTLSNIASGVMIILFRPFAEGDFVSVGNGEMGTVNEISINYTELATVGNVQVIVPNSDVWGNTIHNYSVYPNRQAEWTFGVSYDASLAEAERVISEAIKADDRTQTDNEPLVKVSGLGASSVDFLARAWVSADDYFLYQKDILRAVKEALDEAGIGIPYPHRTIEFRNGLPETGTAAEDGNEDTPARDG